MKKRRNQLILSLLNKTDHYNDENAIYFKWSDVKEEDEEDIGLTNFIESLQKQTDEENFSKKIIRWLFDDCGIVPMKRKIKKIFLKVIFNNKILFDKVANDQDFAKLTGVFRKFHSPLPGGGGVQFLKKIKKKFENQPPCPPLILRKFYHNFFSQLSADFFYCKT